MGNFTFKADISDLRKYAHFMAHTVPRQARWAVAGVLNDLAFKSRQAAIDVLEGNMDIRNIGFVRKHLRVDRANGRNSIDRQEAWFGSVAGPRFTGWVEQQLGDPREQTRTHGVKARGSKSRRVKARYKSGQSIPHSGMFQYKGRSTDEPWKKTWRMLHMLKRARWFNKPFFVQNTTQISTGTYRMTPSGRIKYIGTIAQANNVQNLPWAEMAVQKALRNNSVRDLWMKNFIYQMRKKYRAKR